MQIRDSYPYETTREDFRVPLADGTTLYARVWRPVTDEPVPVLLEYLPYRLSDWTAPRDWQRHPWYAGHGYASVRVDVRGHGNSEGLPTDEYSAQELADGVEVVNWLAAQEWSTGKVGMFGISWGGFNSLQIAALAPEPLKAIVTVCSADDRYDNDVHYMGGSVLAVDMHAWAATMLAFVSRPPDPHFVGDAWRDMWLTRLAAVEPFIHTWLDHQTRDDYWRHGSVCEDYSAIGAAVLAVGGWHDPYRDTVLRLVEHLPDDRVRGLIGPWSHQYPDRGLPPGPSIGFLQETLRWWDHHLKGIDSGVMAEPKLRSWISDSHPPATVYRELSGGWVGDPSWPSPNVTPVPYALQGTPVVVASPQHTGLDAGRYFPFGNDADLPPDQRDEDAKSACFEFEVPARVRILGRPKVTLRLRMDVPYGQAVARLCDVAPDGSSTLVTRGVLNLSARNGRDRADAWPLGATEDVTFELNGIGHTFPPGHRIRLAVSSAYWPWIWPQADSVGFTLEPVGSTLELPVRDGDLDPSITFAPAEQSEPLGVVYPATLDEQRPERLVVRDVAKGEWRLEVDPRYGGTRVYPDGLEFTEDALETYTIQEGDPLSARTRSDWTIRLHRPDLGWDTRVETRSEITCDAADFITSNEVVCKDGDEIVFHRTWEKRIRRTAG
ncbi:MULTISPECIES: CocE/NonD family hydrolase [Streptomyces]|uniref:Peptidase S15 n=1 Tax=Streptomyces venezuelae TaxID=54571 RepID=A0A5P2BFP8_STRVZ|nr:MULTISPECIES: CocE/NonD family hydrolase [Streptomyces]NEA04000.1 CocE/NonD family hydrolase [Streptomyces sp. SID10116]MYY85063.1 CocE/NonD family hydrolase [Streptomyces sp. SID335]MYZ17258.1 CocE/NonD family hydrolase [Streptomyces sp. SID337]NDZ87054.1 CocE/NonD family hydrolase [Streptomyces sp. SID10115]NEB47065.1 CocE/NonD family hydrolase [Streptomyces sp. SID339]